MPISKETILEAVRNVTENVGTYEHRGQLTLLIQKEDLVEVARELRDNQHTQFNQCIDITAIDWFRRKDRFEVVYFLYSIPNKARVRLKVAVQERDPHVPSLVEIYESANWYERETYDMYGIIFDGHPDMRRFYMPEDYVDPETGEPIYPLRKDFPVMGIPGSLPMPPMPERENA